MVVVRQVRLEDLDAIIRLVESAGHGLTSMPRDPELLRQRVLDSYEGFQRQAEKPRGESYLFVLEDQETGEVVGTSGIVSKVGGFEPFYSFRVETHVHESKYLNVRKEISCLHILAEHSGPCEIGSLFVAPEYRKHGNGRLLSLARFLFMAEHPERFEPFVISELRGVVDDEGRCPFWEALGRHFFDVDFPTADRLSARDKRFISELMPTHPIYIPLLTREAQAVLGQVHPRTRPALKMLRDEGFRDLGMVDLFDGGPVVGCDLRHIRTVRESAVAGVGRTVDRELPGDVYLLAATDPEFRVCLGPMERIEGDRVTITRESSASLHAGVGDKLRSAPLRSGTRRPG